MVEEPPEAAYRSSF